MTVGNVFCDHLKSFAPVATERVHQSFQNELVVALLKISSLEERVDRLVHENQTLSKVYHSLARNHKALADALNRSGDPESEKPRVDSTGGEALHKR